MDLDSTAPQPTVASATGTQEAPETGEALFNANCSGCHGEGATGTDRGPPLVHKIYEPSHHADIAFQRAARFGVRAHHWSFGDMPPVQGVTEDEVAKIVAYARALQREKGIY